MAKVTYHIKYNDTWIDTVKAEEGLDDNTVIALALNRRKKVPMYPLCTSDELNKLVDATVHVFPDERIVNPEESFPFIIKWGEMMGSTHGYIEQQIFLANKTHAPYNAVYKRYNAPGWATTDDIRDLCIRERLGVK